MNVNCWRFNLFTVAKMFTNSKWREGIIVNGVGVFVILLVCVCAHVYV